MMEASDMPAITIAHQLQMDLKKSRFGLHFASIFLSQMTFMTPCQSGFTAILRILYLLR